MLHACYLPPVLTTKELAQALVVSPATIRRLAQKGHLPKPVQVGKQLRWDRETILRYIGCSIPH